MNFRLLIILSFVFIMVSDTITYISASWQLTAINGGVYDAVCKVISFSCILFLFSKVKWNREIPLWARIFFKASIIWNVVTIARGFFIAKNYFDWKFLLLNTSFSLFISLVLIVGIMFEYSKNLFWLIITKIFLFGFIVIPLTLKFDKDRELYPRGIVIYVCFFVFASAYFKFKWQLLTLLVAAVTIYLSPDFRTNVIRVGVALFILASYYARKFIPLSLIKMYCLACFIIPLIFLFLGVTKEFNVFKPTDDIDKYSYSYDNGDEKNIAEDTRTFLYQEIFASMIANDDSFLIGEGGAAKYKTEFFDDMGATKEGRPGGSEVGFLNFLLYSGIIGVILYALMLFSAAYYAIQHSNNFLCKMLAMFLAFRWVLFFIEDFNGYNLNYYFIWIAVGLCFSNRFRALTDNDIRQYFNFSIPFPAAWRYKKYAALKNKTA